MGKITVKHYLNKKLKPKTENNKVYYPIYLQIIYNKLSNEKCSDTGFYMTDSSFEDYINEPKISEADIIKTNVWNDLSDLYEEFRSTYDALLVVDLYEFNISRSTIFNVIRDFSKRTSDLLTEVLRNNIQGEIWDKTIIQEEQGLSTQDIKYEQFLLSFSENIIDSISNVEKFTGLNVVSFLKDIDKHRLKSLQIIDSISQGSRFSKFVLSDYKSKLKDQMKKETVEHYELTINDIYFWIKQGVDYIKINNIR